ncbi:MAG TPA: hypothetical protein VM165_10515 [Planctomycetaceae bacterium]|nr:hypothetical protein [Planctomycetaceae bacterium]
MHRLWFCVLILGTVAVLDSMVTAAEWSDAARAAQRRLLEVADQRSPTAPGEARKRFDSVSALADDDRPARYAYGVVLVRLHKAKEALAEFQAAAQSDKGLYPPALRAAVFLQLTGHDWKTAAELTRRLGDALVNAPDAWDTDTAWSADARWLGETVSAAQLLVTTAGDVKLWADVDQQLRTALPGDLRADYVAGFDAVVQRHSELTAKVEAVRQDAVNAEGEKNEAVRKEVLTAKQKVAAQRENLKAAAGDWKKLYDDQMAEFGKQLGKLEKDWNSLDSRRQSLERSIVLTQQEIVLMQQHLDRINSQNNNNARNNNNNGNRVTFGLDLVQTYNVQLGQRQASLLQYQFDWNRTNTQQNQVQQQATGLLNQRQSAIADYQQRTGQLVDQDGQLDKWNGRLAKQAAELDEPPTGQNGQTRSLQQKLKTVGAYVPWDWEAERQRLLKETTE